MMIWKICLLPQASVHSLSNTLLRWETGRVNWGEGAQGRERASLLGERTEEKINMLKHETTSTLT